MFKIKMDCFGSTLLKNHRTRDIKNKQMYRNDISQYGKPKDSMFYLCNYVFVFSKYVIR